MKQSLKKLANLLSYIFFIVITVCAFAVFTNNTVTEKDANNLSYQIAFNQENKKEPLTVDGVKSDGTKMTTEEIEERKEIEKQIKDVDIFTPEIIKLCKKVNFNVSTLLFAVVLAIVILSLLNYGVFKAIFRVSLAILISSSLNIAFIYNLSRYITMGNIQKICSLQITLIMISFITVILASILDKFMETREQIKEHKKSDEKIKERLERKKAEEAEILEEDNKDPIFIIATKQDSTVTTVKEDSINRQNTNSEELQDLKRTAYVDSLTKLYNRAAFDKDRKKAKLKNTGIIMLDVNNLKRTNDTFGHKEGDKLICYAADYIRMLFGKFGKCYRLGGDEFVILLQDIDNEKEILQATNDLNPTLEKNNTLVFPVIVALGYAKYDEMLDADLDSTLSRADELMYKNKKLLKEQNPHIDEIFKNANQEANNNDIKDSDTLKEEQPVNIKEQQTNLESEEEPDEVMNISINKQELEEKLKQQEQDIINREKEKHQKELEAIKQEQINREKELQNKMEEEQRKIQEEREKQRLEAEKIAQEKEAIKKDREKLTSDAPVVERIVERIDGSVERVEGDGTVMANYESIRNYLDKKENKNPYFVEDKPLPQPTADLPFANYNPETDSPFVKQEQPQKEVKKLTIITDDVDEDDC
jgi:diguanylate cyclase (GGDEF)-like protein